MMEKTKQIIDRAGDMRERYGTPGVARWMLNKAMVKGLSLDLVHVLSLVPEEVDAPELDGTITMRFLTPDEVRRFSSDPAYQLPESFVARAEGGLDFCFGALQGDRLANYGWYAIRSVEAEHAAGAQMGLPDDIAYMYKGFTHPDFRGRRIYGACMSAALDALGDRGIGRFVSMVYWSNEPALRSVEHLGYRRLGLLAVGPTGPLRVPRAATDLGVTFGRDADEAVAARRSPPPLLRTA
jgi:ribosomal protein S18 acetylase RimI-like enzyme